MYNYRVQWCGIGDIDESTCSPTPAPPPPSVAPPPPPPGGGGSEKPPKMSFLNIRCADFRDKYKTFSVNKQKEYYSECMSQDCVQSLESSKDNPGCRYLDPEWNFCFAYGATQTWCEAHPGNKNCIDKGSTLFGGKKAPNRWTPHQDVNEYDKGVKTGKKYSCQCMENCSCTKKKCWCSDPDQKPWPETGDNFEKQEKRAAKKKGHIKKKKDGECRCSCDKKGF